jgi:phospholipid transport system substrate-binding protein
MALVDTKIMPNVNFQRMTASAVGPAWRQATPEQQKRLQEEFKTLLVRTYAGALDQVNDQTISLKPQRGAADRYRGCGSHRSARPRRPDPARLPAGKDAGGWKIYNLNVLGVWLVETYAASSRRRSMPRASTD